MAVVMGALACPPGLVHALPASWRASLSVKAPWCLAARPSVNVAGYLVIYNKGYAPDRLTAITSPVAQRVSMHESKVAGGFATMTNLRSVEIPARTTVTFAPGGLHIMLEALRRPLAVGDRVPITLWFNVSGPVRTNLVVMMRPLMATPPSSMPM
jgi:copper(I)-binding protein